MRLTLKTVAGAVYELTLENHGTVSDIIRTARVAHSIRIKALVSRGAVVDSSSTLAAAGLDDGSVVVVLLQKTEPVPVEPEPEQQRAEAAPHQRLEDLEAGAVPLSNWMGHLPEAVRTQRSICEIALPCAHNAGARSIHTVPRSMIAKFIGDSMANVPFVEQIARPIASAMAICQTLTISELLATGVRGLDLRVGMHEGEVHVCHTVVCDLTLSAALGEVAEFLHGARNEMVVVLIKCDWEMRTEWTTEHWQQVQAVVMSVLDDVVVCSEEELALPLDTLVTRGHRAVVLLEVPPTVDMWCGIRSTNGLNLKSSWSDRLRTPEDVFSAADAWRASGEMHPQGCCIKLLECALPGNPLTSAAGLNARLQQYMAALEVPLQIAINVDSPDEATIRAIVVQNWRKQP